MTSKHLDGLLKITVASRKKAVALNRVDVRKVGCQWVVAHKVLCSGRVHPVAQRCAPRGIKSTDTSQHGWWITGSQI